jgi:hypothetical protein
MEKQVLARVLNDLAGNIDGATAIAAVIDEATGEEEMLVVGPGANTRALEPTINQVRQAARRIRRKGAGQ